MRLLNGVSIYRIQWRHICILAARENAILSQVFEQACSSFGKINQNWQRQNSQWGTSARWNVPLIYRLPHTRNLNVMQTNKLLHFLLYAYAANESTLSLREFYVNSFNVAFAIVVNYWKGALTETGTLINQQATLGERLWDWREHL